MKYKDFLTWEGPRNAEEFIKDGKLLKINEKTQHMETYLTITRQKILKSKRKKLKNIMLDW